MQITINVEKVDGLFLKEEMGTGKIGDEELSFGICVPGGAPYVHVRGEYYVASDTFEVMLRAVHEQEHESHEEHPAPCDEHVAQPVTPQDCPAGVDICAGSICTHEPDAAEPDDPRPDES